MTDYYINIKATVRGNIEDYQFTGTRPDFHAITTDVKELEFYIAQRDCSLYAAGDSIDHTCNEDDWDCECGKLLDVKEGDVIAHIDGYYGKEEAVILEQARKYQTKLINNGAEVIMSGII